jgi:hypothetical protein
MLPRPRPPFPPTTNQGTDMVLTGVGFLQGGSMEPIWDTLTIASR